MRDDDTQVLVGSANAKATTLSVARKAREMSIRAYDGHDDQTEQEMESNTRRSLLYSPRAEGEPSAFSSAK